MAAKKRKKKKDGPDRTRYFLKDFGHHGTIDYLESLLNTSEFKPAILKAANGPKSSDKKEVVRQLAWAIADSNKDLTLDAMMVEFCKQPRDWLAFQLGGVQDAPKLGSAKAFLTTRRKNGWHGPFEDGDTVWYVYVHHQDSFEFITEGQPNAAFPIRWHVVAGITEGYVAVHWFNFTHNEEREEEPGRLFHPVRLLEAHPADHRRSW